MGSLGLNRNASCATCASPGRGRPRRLAWRSSTHTDRGPLLVLVVPDERSASADERGPGAERDDPVVHPQRGGEGRAGVVPRTRRPSITTSSPQLHPQPGLRGREYPHTATSATMLIYDIGNSASAERERLGECGRKLLKVGNPARVHRYCVNIEGRPANQQTSSTSMTFIAPRTAQGERGWNECSTRTSGAWQRALHRSASPSPGAARDHSDGEPGV